MVFADTPGTQEDYDRFYTTWSIYQNPAMSATPGSPSAFDLSRFEQAASKFEQIIPKDARILDVGCANGGLLQALARRGFQNLAGVDPAPGCVQFARAAGFEAWQGEITHLPKGIGPFDVVVLTAVLEHVLDVQGAIRSLLEVCAPDGRIILEVPDAMRYPDFLNAPFQDFNTEHINHFSPASLRNLMGPFGLHAILEEDFMVTNAAGLEFADLLTGYQRNVDVPVPPLVKDTLFRGEIERYIELSKAMMARLDRQLETALSGTSEVVVWGTGQLSMKLLCDSCLSTKHIQFFVDGNPVQDGRILRGVQILSPEKLPSSDAPIIITTLLHTDGIRTRIAALGLKNPVVTLTAYDSNSNTEPNVPVVQNGSEPSPRYSKVANQTLSA